MVVDEDNGVELAAEQLDRGTDMQEVLQLSEFQIEDERLVGSRALPANLLHVKVGIKGG